MALSKIIDLSRKAPHHEAQTDQPDACRGSDFLYELKRCHAHYWSRSVTYRHGMVDCLEGHYVEADNLQKELERRNNNAMSDLNILLGI